MDVPSLASHAITALVSAASAIATTAFILGRKLGEMEEREKVRDRDLKSLKETLNNHIEGDEKKFERLEDRSRQLTEEANDQWNRMERTLGQIEGTLKTTLLMR